MLARRVALVLRIGALFFIILAPLLLVAPNLLLSFLGFTEEVDSRSSVWLAFQLMGVLLVALSGFMYWAAGNFNEAKLIQSAYLMLAISTALTLLTLRLPGDGKWFFAAVGILFAVFYLRALRGYRSRR
jgi:hypothetical protein